MPKRSVLADLVNSATAAKVHFEVWWAQANEAKPALLRQMNAHSDFFRASFDAHYTAYHVYVAHLFDATPRTASIAAYLKEIKARTPAAEFKVLEAEYKDLQKRAKTLVVARHKTVAHIDQFMTEKEVFARADPITYNETRDLIYDSAQFVAKLAGHGDQPGLIGIARDRRLMDATLKLIRALPSGA
eukprot:TRINITY_DN10369_c0_g1_i6.p1 TRINITY_DN10369_c0_g1~~TRINITY_DN10369_c0_g1_i6.p1  ORF type:complete len:187 (+),score=20.55 TRINITY_DN10369_c0_g1_i6:43-603(+)